MKYISYLKYIIITLFILIIINICGFKVDIFHKEGVRNRDVSDIRKKGIRFNRRPPNIRRTSIR